jgi:6-phosphogluconolactonase
MKVKTLLRVLPNLVVVLCIVNATLNATEGNASTFAYISNADSHDIYVMELNEGDGSLKLVQRVQVSGSVMPLAISPNNKYLYASLRSQPYSVSTFVIDQKSGKLSSTETVPLADDMAYISTDRSGRYLFGASYFGNKFSINRISSNGEVDATPLHVIPTGKNAHCILTDLSNRLLFVSNLGDDAILQYRFDETKGDVTPNQPAAVRTRKGAGPRHFVFHSNGRFVFGTNELDGTLNTYALSTSGTLTLLASTSVLPVNFKGKPWTADIHLTPDGRFLYASERTTSTITGFRVDESSGKLSLIGGYPTEAQPRGFNIDPDGTYLLVVGQKSNALSTYLIDKSTGRLRKLSHVRVGANPNWVEIVRLPAVDLAQSSDLNH